MPSPTDTDRLEAKLASLHPEPSGEPGPEFLSALRGRRREVRAQRAGLAVVALAVAITVWQLTPRPGSTNTRTDEPRAVAGDGTQSAPSGTSLASLRRLYASPSGDSLTLREFPAAQAVGRAEPPLTPRDTQRLLAGGA